MTTVKIGDKVLTIMSDTVDPVMEAGAALEKYFMPEESEIEEPEAGAVESGAVEAVLPGLPSEDAMAGEMETESSGQATEMPTLDCSEGGDNEDTSGGARDSDRCPGLAQARPEHRRGRGHRGGGDQRPGAQHLAPATAVRVWVTS